MRSSFSFVLPALLSLTLAPLPGCGGDEFSSDPGDSSAGTGGTAQGGAGNGQSGAGQSQGGAGSGQGGAGSGQGGAGSGQGGAGSGQGGAGTSQGGAGSGQGGSGGTEQGGAGTAQGGAGNGQSGAGQSQGGAGTSQGGAGTEQGGAGTAQGGAGTSQGGAGTDQGGAGTTQGGAGTTQGGAGGAPQCTTNNECAGGPNATASCQTGVCVLECLPGFAKLEGLCRDFGGAYVQTESGDCNDHNPLTSAAESPCSCPGGFTPFTYENWPYGKDLYASLVLCAPKKPVGQFGGAFIMNSLGQCLHELPYDPGGCGCPAPFELSSQPIFNKSQGAEGDDAFDVCLDPNAGGNTPTIRGIYEKYSSGDVGTPSNPKDNCLASSLDQGACACPSGSIENKVTGARLGVKASGMLAATFPTDIVFCLAK